MLDTYRTFGCETGEPTFRYSLLDGVREGFLINPLVVDARTGVTTQLLSDIGYAAVVISDAPDSERTSEQQFKQRSLKRSFSPNPPTSCFAKLCSRTACATPSAASLAKPWCLPSTKITPPCTQILNDLAAKQYPGRYQSDFAVQVTSLTEAEMRVAVQDAVDCHFDVKFRPSFQLLEK